MSEEEIFNKIKEAEKIKTIGDAVSYIKSHQG